MRASGLESGGLKIRQKRGRERRAGGHAWGRMGSNHSIPQIKASL